MTVREQVENLVETLTSVLDDAAKHDRGNAAAGTRVRKAMQSVKHGAQEVRLQVQADKNNR
jgi:hypothetical protein